VENGMESLADAAEQDVVFSCNLLERTYGEIRRLSPDERRRAIRERLEAIAPTAPIPQILKDVTPQ
jgi:hypothetical protein